MKRNNRNVRNITIAVICYIVVVGLNIWGAITSYFNFIDVYGDREFSKGLVGVLICTSGNVVYTVIATILIVVYIKRKLGNDESIKAKSNNMLL